MKKVLLATALVASLISANLLNIGGSTEVEASSIESTSSSWVWTYTDYNLADGWYEKWYINVKTEQTKKEVYNSKGQLVTVKYF